MNKKRALQLAREWAQGHRCTLQDGEAAEYHAMFASMLEKSTPNELLTLEQLRQMDGDPVWVELYRAWALVEVKQNGSIMFYGNSFSCPYSRTWKVYRFRPDRRPPEEEEDI